MAENQSFVRKVISKLSGAQKHMNGGEVENFPRTSSLALQRDGSKARDSGKYLEARECYQEAIITDPTNSGAYVVYVNFLILRGDFEAAWEIAQLLLIADPSSTDGLEIFLELAVSRKSKSGIVTRKISNFSETILNRADRHRDALDFLIPHKLFEPLKEVANSSSDEVAKWVADLHLKLSEQEDADFVLQALNGKPDESLILTHLWLARGKTGAAIDAINQLAPEDVPMNSLRRAIRRAKNSNKMKMASKYATIYLKYAPNDKWAKSIADIYNPLTPSNYLLGNQGYKFPKFNKQMAYSADQKKVFYMLHNSLPHHSAGYATRTHGLLSELNKSDWTVNGVTRLGYPYDMPGMSEIGEIPDSDLVGDVLYRRLNESMEIEKKNPLFNYVDRYSKNLINLAKSERPAIIHAASNHWNGLAAVTAANKLGIPSVYEVRGLWEVTRGSRNPEWAQGNMFKFMARMEADAARGATKVFTITRALKTELVRRGVDASKIEIIPNGVDSKRFTPQDKDTHLGSTLGLEGKTVIGYVGSILDYEGIELLIEAASRLSEVRDDFHVLIVGDGAELEKFKNMVAAEDLTDVISFTGRVPHEQVESYYSLIDITPFPRLPLPVCEMVSPLKPFEAMAMGKAVVASDVDALAEIVIPGLNGLLHEKGNIQSLTDQIRLLLDDEDLRLRLGSQAREWVVNERDWNKLASIISDSYDELWNSLKR